MDVPDIKDIRGSRLPGRGHLCETSETSILIKTYVGCQFNHCSHDVENVSLMMILLWMNGLPLEALSASGCPAHPECRSGRYACPECP
jgi:hypothetical protein